MLKYLGVCNASALMYNNNSNVSSVSDHLVRRKTSLVPNTQDFDSNHSIYKLLSMNLTVTNNIDPSTDGHSLSDGETILKTGLIIIGIFSGILLSCFIFIFLR